jgi:hypothetical protein
VGVVVEAAHEGRLDAVGDAEGIEPGAHAIEVSGGAIAQPVGDVGRVGDHGAGLRALAVEDPHGMAVDLLLVVVGEVATALAQPPRELGDVGPPILGRAHRVDGEGEAAQAQGAQVGVAEGDDLDIEVGIGGAQGLDVDLVVLAEAACLRALVAEARRDRPHLPGDRGSVLHERAHDRRRDLRAEREVAVALVVEVVHLLADDVGALTQPLEDADVLEHGLLQQPVAGPVSDAGEGGDERLPPRRFGREDVLGADRRLEGGGRGGVGHGPARLPERVRGPKPSSRTARGLVSTPTSPNQCQVRDERWPISGMFRRQAIPYDGD